MKITKNLEIAIDMVVELRKVNTASRVQDIATQIGTSLSFLEQVSRKLRMAGIVDSVRGPGGGVVLSSSRPISVREVASALGIENKVISGKSDAVTKLGMAMEVAYNVTI